MSNIYELFVVDDDYDVHEWGWCNRDEAGKEERKNGKKISRGIKLLLTHAWWICVYWGVLFNKFGDNRSENLTEWKLDDVCLN